MGMWECWSRVVCGGVSRQVVEHGVDKVRAAEDHDHHGVRREPLVVEVGRGEHLQRVHGAREVSGRTHGSCVWWWRCVHRLAHLGGEPEHEKVVDHEATTHLNGDHL